MSRALALTLVFLLPLPVSAQSVRYRRPYDEAYRLNYGFDHDGSTGDDLCVDYACSDSCYDGHTGSDLGAPFGTTVLAAADGVVTATNDGCASYGSLGNTCGGRCGNHVRIRHDDGSSSLYCHMQLGSIRVSSGQRVGCGQPIGTSASSGSSTGPHLHFGHTSPGSGAASDPWAGGCSRGNTLWVDQGGYRGPPSPSCSCAASGESCNGADDDCDGRIDEDVRRSCGTDEGECVSGISTCSGGGWGACVGAVDPVPERCDRLDDDCDGTTDEAWVCEQDEIAWGLPVYDTSVGARSDVNGDGRADACASLASGFSCLASSANGFTRAIAGGSVLADASSIRMGDVDGDGRDDVCAIEDERVICRRSTGASFGTSVAGPTTVGATSLALVDLDGDGRQDACVRAATGLVCALSDERGFGRVVSLAALSDAGGFAEIVHWGSLRFGDLDGDGRSDVCARDADGLDCWLGEGDRFGARIRGPRWSDASGYGALGYWSTLRLADVDGDGRDDVCMRTPDGLVCARSLGAAFGDLVVGPAMQGAAWDRPDGYATLRMADVSGDGRADACARDGERLRCWLSNGRAFDRVIEGPAMRDADGFTDAAVRFRSLRLADVDGDGRADACARYADGLHCAVSDGHGFDEVWLGPRWSDASELSEDARSASIRIGGMAVARGGDDGLVGVFGCAVGGARSRLAWLASLLVGVVLRMRRQSR